MTDFIDLNRHFKGLTREELEDPEVLAFMSDGGYGKPPSWHDILEHQRVVILAEAGSGKTREMIEKARHLASENKAAFFIALETLDREKLSETFDASQTAVWERWKGSDDEIAWFFLDAVDELKLTSGKLDRALARLSREIEPHLDRARVVISCRPSDWRAETDLATVTSRLPIHVREPVEEIDAKETFLSVVRGRGRTAEFNNTEKKDSPDATAPWVVVLLPLSENQIRTFAEKTGAKNVDAFVEEIHRRDALEFARRPLDLVELIAVWNAKQGLGTRSEQHEANIWLKLHDDAERPDADALSDSDALAGAKKLALALTLSRTATILTPFQDPGERHETAALDPAVILESWSVGQRASLLRRGLFDPATYGRVRFHHRSVREYLAARRLYDLRVAGMSTSSLFRLLFNDKYGERIIIPSMRPIAAWLSLWDDAVRKEVIDREPEVLLTLGDPESLRLPDKQALLRSFAAAYGKGSWRGLNIPHAEVRRLATPELAHVVRELWADGPENEELRELLLEIMWLGQIRDCADIAFKAATDTTLPYHHRQLSVEALVTMKADDALAKIVPEIARGEPDWPGTISRSLVQHLFPEYLTVPQLLEIVSRAKHDKYSVGGVDWAMQKIAEKIHPASQEAIELRRGLATLMWESRGSSQEFFRPNSRHAKLGTALAILCARQIESASGPTDADLLRACTIAARFSDSDYGKRDAVSKMQGLFQNDAARRQGIFWAELKFMDALLPGQEEWNRYYNAQHSSLLGKLTDADRPWLLAALRDTDFPERKPVALQALIILAVNSQDATDRLEEIRKSIAGDTKLENILAQRTAPTPPNPEIEATLKSQEARQQEHDVKEEKRVHDWEKWRDEVIAKPERFFGEEVTATIQNMYRWLNLREARPPRLNVWNRGAVVEAFNEEIAVRLETALRSYWRQQDPVPSVHRPDTEKQSTPYSWAYGLTGLAVETSNPSWAAGLTEAEAVKAARYATIEFNGFSSYLPDLARSHPAAVETVLGDALEAEFAAAGSSEHLTILHNVAYGDASLKKLLQNRAAQILLRGTDIRIEEEAAQRWARHASLLLGILRDIDNPETRKELADLCEVRFLETAGAISIMWIEGLFSFDVDRGVRVLSDYLTEVSAGKASEKEAVKLVAELFGNRSPINLNIKDPTLRSRALGKLVRLAYATVRPQDDVDHGTDVYSPGERDHAEQARNYLLNALISSTGAEARTQLLELAADPKFSHFPDRLRLLARQRAAEDSEFEPYPASEIARLDKIYELPPVDRDGLFRVMLDRISDLAHEISTHDFSDRETLLTIETEPAMQKSLALRLDHLRKDAFKLTREEEVVDGNLTDIRLLATRSDERAVIEIKLGQKPYTVKDLENTLREQILGKYLRHEKCKAACLLITYNGKRSHWVHPETGEKLSFPALIEYLDAKAREIERENLHRIRLAVRGLDLTDA